VPIRSFFIQERDLGRDMNPLHQPSSTGRKTPNVADRTVSSLVRALCVILMAFALSSLLVYRLRLARTLRRSTQSQPTTRLVEETKIIEGEIQSVDSNSRTLTLINEGKEVTLGFDERTSITESGRPVQPTSIVSGTSASVKCAQRGGKTWARRIELIPAQPPESSDGY
jgi:hypothetical protein